MSCIPRGTSTCGMEQDSSPQMVSKGPCQGPQTATAPARLTWEPTPAAPPVLGAPWSSHLPVPTELHCPCTCAWTAPWALLSPAAPAAQLDFPDNRNLWTSREAAVPSKAIPLWCPEQGGHCSQHCGHLWLLACLPAWNSPILRLQPQKSQGSLWALSQGSLR